MNRIDYEVRTAANVLVRTFDREDVACKWLRERRAELPGARVERVEYSVVRTKVYAPRMRLAA